MEEFGIFGFGLNRDFMGTWVMYRVALECARVGKVDF